MFLNRRDTRRELRTGAVLASVAAAMAAIAGCGGSSSNSSTSANFGTAVSGVSNGTARSYILTDNANNPLAIGVEVSRGAIDNPAQVSVYPDAAAFNLTLPTTTPQLPFRSATFFSTSGHGPDFGPVAGPYEVPHYHVSFSLYTIQQRGTATSHSGIGANLWGISASYPDASTYLNADANFNTPDVYSPNPLQPADTPYKIYVPISPAGKAYFNYSDMPFTPLVPGSTTQHMGQELPSLGTVLYDPDVPEFNQVNPGPFAHESDWQFFNGSMSAITITVPRNELVAADKPGTQQVQTPTHINVTVPLGQPQAFQTTGYYPSTYTIRYNASSDTYDFELGGMKFHQGVDINGNPQVKKG